MKASLKYLIISLISIMIIFILSIWYFFNPLEAKKIITGFEEVNYIYFGDYKKGLGPTDIYTTNITEQSTVSLILEKFENTKYNRRLGYKNIANDGRYISMRIFYGKENHHYILEVNNTGYIVVDEKTYKLTENEEDVFNQVYESIMSVPNLEKID